MPKFTFLYTVVGNQVIVARKGEKEDQEIGRFEFDSPEDAMRVLETIRRQNPSSYAAVTVDEAVQRG